MMSKCLLWRQSDQDDLHQGVDQDLGPRLARGSELAHAPVLMGLTLHLKLEDYFHTYRPQVPNSIDAWPPSIELGPQLALSLPDLGLQLQQLRRELKT